MKHVSLRYKIILALFLVSCILLLLLTWSQTDSHGYVLIIFGVGASLFAVVLEWRRRGHWQY